MITSFRPRWSILTASIGLICLIGIVLTVSPNTTAAQQVQAPADGYIGGTVSSSAGPEAGVWVIAETDDLLTPMIKIVVTDDDGRYMLPELPDAEYDVWVRGYGLRDSEPIQVTPNADNVELGAVLANTPQEAAEVYPGNYWWSLIDFPGESEFPGTGPEGNGISPDMASQAHYVHAIKSNCNFCHQVGNALTRDLEHVYDGVDAVTSDREAWDHRLRAGVRGGTMSGVANRMGRDGILDMLVDWTDRIQAGEVPEAPPRPDGIEQNLVLTLWDWGTDHSFMHDEISTDKNNPTVNANGPVYAVSAGHGSLVVLDPIENSTYEIDIPTREPRDQVRSRFPAPNPASLWFGEEALWTNPPYNPADPHNPMLDSTGRVWMTSKIRQNAPEWCSDPAVTKYAEYFPLFRGGRQASYYEPDTGEFTLIETCYSTHHLQFDTDENETVYFNELSGSMFGWLDTKVYDQTGDEQQAVGWCGQVVDTNGDGQITLPFNRPVGGAPGNPLYLSDTPQGPGNRGGPAPEGAGPPDPNLDTQVSFNMYSVIPSPVSDAVYGAAESFPGYLIRLSRGNNPPQSCTTEVFQVPEPGLDPRGLDIDSNGVVWTALAASSHLASFDYSKCTSLTPQQKLDGTGCQEGWALYRTDGPRFTGTQVPADFHYFGWVDQHNISGFGENTPFATGSNSDALLALDPETGDWATLRVPYPMGFYSRGMDGRIDDPEGGWKGRALWANYGTHFVWHIEGGKGTKGKMVKFQIRPDPLSR